MLQTHIDQWHRRADRVGIFSLQALQGMKRFFRLFGSILHVFLRMRWISRPAVMNVVVRQVYFTGVQSLPWVIGTIFSGDFFIGTLGCCSGDGSWAHAVAR